MTDLPTYTREEHIAALIESVSAYIEQYHCGLVELIGIEGEVVKVRLGGACENCPQSAATLQGWVAGTIHQFFPDVQVVAEETGEE